ncbi:MAG: hypothetical protein ACK5NN_11225 [Sphingomonadaceae bacterium]
MPSRPLRLLAVLAVATALAGCNKTGELVINEGVGVSQVRTACPAVGVPDYTGDITLFRTPGVRTADNIDITASMTNVRSQCNEEGERVYTGATFDVQARRTDVRGSRQVELPYYSTILRGGTSVVAKRIGSVVLTFADGQERAQASGTAGAYIDRSAATLPPEIRERITRKRRAGDADAALDPLADPEVKSALARANFELLVGFQLTPDQLAYNVTR